MEGYNNYNKFLSGKVKLVGKGSVKGTLHHVDKGYPGLVSGDGLVYGEIFEVNNKFDVLKVLDKLEGYIKDGYSNNMYNRILREVTNLETSEKLSLYVYEYQMDSEINSDDKHTLVESGDWRKYMDNKILKKA